MVAHLDNSSVGTDAGGIFCHTELADQHNDSLAPGGGGDIADLPSGPLGTGVDLDGSEHLSLLSLVQDPVSSDTCSGIAGAAPTTAVSRPLFRRD